MATATTSDAEKVHGVLMSKASRPHMVASLKSMGIKFDDKATDSVIVGLLAERYRKLPKLGKWDVCGGMSDPSTEWCGYCGTKEDGTLAALDEAKDNGSNGASTAQKGAKDMATTEESGKKKGKGSKKEEKSTALAKTNGASTAVVSKTDEAELNRAVANVRSIMADGAGNYWRLGKQLAEIHEKQLWKNRTEDGKVKFKSFDQFCAGELGMSAMNAYRAIDVAKEYDEETARKLGMTKLALVLQAPKSARDQLEKDLKEGATARQVREKVKAAREKEGVTRRETGRKKTPKGDHKAAVKAKKAKAGSAGRVTIALIDSVKTVRLHAKGTDDKPVKKIGDQPWGKLELTNEVEMHFAVVETSAGEWVLKVKTKRIEAE